MGTNLPDNFSNGTELEASDLNKMLTARTNSMLPIDDTTRNNTDQAGALGSATYAYTDIYMKGAIQNAIMAQGGIFSFGNGKDGDAPSSPYSAVGMGGEYWFNDFEIDADITVRDTIGWLVIRANTITVTKGGGATINGKGKSVAAVGTAGVNPADNTWALRAGAGGNGYMCGSAGTGGGGADGGANVVTRNVDTQANHGGQGGAVYYDPAWFEQADVGSATTANTDGENGDNGVSFPASYFNVYISTGCKSFGASSGGGGASSDNGTGHRAGVAGAKGGGGIALICKNLVLEEDLDIDTSGDDGTDGTSGNFNGSGGSGGGGAANNLVAYITKTDVGTLTQIADGGTGGAGGIHSGAEQDGGNGGNGGDGLTIEYNVNSNTITIA